MSPCSDPELLSISDTEPWASGLTLVRETTGPKRRLPCLICHIWMREKTEYRTIIEIFWLNDTVILLCVPVDSTRDIPTHFAYGWNLNRLALVST